MLKDLTPAQQAAIYLHVVGNFKEWDELFKIAEGTERYNNLTDKSKRQTVSKFRRSDKISEGIQELKYKIKVEEERIREEERSRAETEGREEQPKPAEPNYINLLDRDTFLEEINRGANQAKEEKDKREYLKMISDNLRYKDTERDENNEIQRFYTPITCENCAIYQKCKSCNVSSCPAML